jgi:hypothetical protein
MRLRLMRVTSWLALATCVAVVVGCSPSGNGTVSGVVHVYGGPSDPATGMPANTGQPTPGQEVLVVDSKGARTIATSDPSGRYQLSLPPGDYKTGLSRSRPCWTFPTRAEKCWGTRVLVLR